jgi:hypothetical protein
MYFEEALKTELESITELTNKVFPLVALEGVEPPYLVYISSEGLLEKYYDGYYTGTLTIQAELHILSNEYPLLKDITRKVISKVVSFQSSVIGGDGGVMIYDVTYEKPVENYIPELLQFLCIVPISVRI